MLLDRRSIILSAILDSQKSDWGINIHKVMELHSPDSCNQLMNYSVNKAPEQRMSFMGKAGAVGETADFGEDVLPEVGPGGICILFCPNSPNPACYARIMPNYAH